MRSLCAKIALTWVAILFCSTGVNGQIDEFNSMDFSKADSMATLYPDHSLQDLRLLATKLTRPLSTEEEKFRAIYKWICNNIAYDYDIYRRNKREREKLVHPDALKIWNNKISTVVFRTLLNEHKTVCTGYAYLVKELAYHAGLSCRIVDGFGLVAKDNRPLSKLPNHTWNEIRLNGEWYPCDATWSSGAMNTTTWQYVRKYNNRYFLQDRAEFEKRHVRTDSAPAQ
ncbi:MAG: transglutaminase domain-containing protein [Chryseolinea sp.]